MANTCFLLFSVLNKSESMTDEDMIPPDYWWMMDGRHLIEGYYEPRASMDVKLEVIKVAAHLLVTELQEVVKEALWIPPSVAAAAGQGRGSFGCPPKWVSDVMRMLTAKTIEEFCGGLLREPKLDPIQMAKVEGRHVPRGRKEMMRDICEWGLTERVFNLKAVDPLFLTGVFPVPKSNGFWRVISDCRELNAWIRCWAALELPALGEIFTTVRCFRFFAVFDVRAAFFQIPLAEVARNLFIMVCGDESYRARVYQMGYLNAPWTCEAVMALLLTLAAQRAGWRVHDSAPGGNSPRRILVMYDKNDLVVGRCTIWLDNWLLAMATERGRQALLDELFRQHRDPVKLGLFHRVGLVIKESAQDPDVIERYKKSGQPIPEGLLGVALSENEVEFLNIEFKHDPEDTNSVLWRHLKLEKWDMIRKIPSTATYRNYTVLIGVLMWHWQVTGEDKGMIAPVVRLSQRLGGVIDYDALLVLDPSTVAELTPFVDDLFKEGLRSRKHKPLPKARVMAVSDAMGKAGAGVTWNKKGRNPAVIFKCYWDAQEAAEGINIRETKAGIRTILKVVEDLMEPTAVIFGTDNVTARAALLSGFYPGNELLTNELQAMKARIRDKCVLLVVLHVPGAVLAADAPSRDKDLDPEACKATYEILYERWFSLQADERLRANENKRLRSF